MNTTTNAPITTNTVTTTKAPTTTTSAEETTVTVITETTVSEVTESTVTERFPTETTPRDPMGGGICEPANVVHETSWTKGTWQIKLLRTTTSENYNSKSFLKLQFDKEVDWERMFYPFELSESRKGQNITT